MPRRRSDVEEPIGAWRRVTHELLTPPGTQYGATLGKVEERNRLGMRDLQTRANLCNALFITRNEMRSAVRVRSSALCATDHSWSAAVTLAWLANEPRQEERRVA